MYNVPQTQEAWRIAEEELRAGIGDHYAIHRQARPIKSRLGKIFAWLFVILLVAWMLFFFFKVFYA